MKKILLAIAATVLFTGCYKMRFMPYAGGQQDWPTSAGSFMATNGPLPIYYGYPPKPYIYLGQIRVESQSTLIDATQVAAGEAKKRGADALMVIDDADRFGGSYSAGSGSAMSVPGRPGMGVGFGSSASAAVYLSTAKTIAIKFK